MAMRGTAPLDEDVEAEAVVGPLVCSGVEDEPVASTAVFCSGLTAGCLWRWRFATCFLAWVTGVELVVGGGVEVVTGCGVEVVTGGGLLVVVGGAGVLVVGGGGGGGGVPATATDATPSPAASATVHPTIDPMTLVALNVPPASTPAQAAHATWYSRRD
jgi:hypothetical protein